MDILEFIQAQAAHHISKSSETKELTTQQERDEHPSSCGGSSTPIFPHHAGPTDTNVHVDATTGGITGVVDRSNPSLSPFGTSSYGMDIALGIQSTNEWHCHPYHIELRKTVLGASVECCRTFN